MTPLHKAAREWAQAGWPVFPCRVGRKEPACASGHKEATCDLNQIDTWWTENGDYNVGCAPDLCNPPCFVLDVDPPLGFETLKTLEANHGNLPDTYSVRTPRGGRHLWFEGRCPSTVAKLGAKLDTRGIGGYVLLPPSIIAPGEYSNNPQGGSYEQESPFDPVPAPAWIGETLGRSSERAPGIGSSSVIPDLENNRARAITYLERLETAHQGAGADGTTYRTAAFLRDLGLSEDTTLEIMLAHYKCEPQDDRYEAFLTRKITHAFRYATNEAGAYAADPQTDFAEAAKSVPRPDNRVRNDYHWRSEAEQDTRQEPEWIIEGLIPRRGLVMMFGQLESYKSFLALDLAMGIAAGEVTFGAVPRQGTVGYIAGEGAAGFERRRRPAWRLSRGLLRPVPQYTIDTMPYASDPDTVAKFIEATKTEGHRPEMLVIDTFADFMYGLDENSAKDVGLANRALQRIRDALECTVMIVHHSGKDKDRGSRGNSAVPAKMDTVIEIVANKSTKTVAAHVRKQKDAERGDIPFYFQGKVFGPSLAFSPISADVYRTLNASESPVSKSRVYKALEELGAQSRESAVTRSVLAAHLAPTSDEAAGAIEKLLGKAGAAGGPLEAYHDGSSWFIST